MSETVTLLDATGGASLEAHRAEAKRLERDGELLRAYDAAMRGLAHHPGDLELQYRAVLSLASAGATHQAIARFQTFGLRDRVDPKAPDNRLMKDVAALRARLMKDLALAMPAGRERSAKLHEAADRYGAIYAWYRHTNDRDAYYPGINEASLRHLAGDLDRARARAAEIACELDARPAAARSYFEIATAIEALMLLDQIDRARTLVPAALAAQAAQQNFRDRAATARQLRLVGVAGGQDVGWLTELAPPRVIHFAGHIIAPPGRPGRFAADEEQAVRRAIEHDLDARRAGFGYGSLAAGADILFAEALLARKAELNVFFPFDRDEFVAVSVRPAGAVWVERFEACLAAAASVTYATTDAYLDDDRLFAYCSQLAMGLALWRARHLGTLAEQIVVWDGGPRSGEAGTAADAERWTRTRHPQTVIACGRAGSAAAPAPVPPVEAGSRRTRAMLFGDVKGFSKLNDRQLPRFTEAVLGLFARVLDRHAAGIELVNTWGDGLFAVFGDAAQAARCALDLQQAMARLDLAAHDLPDHISLRLGGHLGPVFPTFDPVLKRMNFFGAHVSRAARIEPVTPPGYVYVTETFAAVLELYNADEFTCDYVGWTESAKGYGAMRMFLLRHTPAGFAAGAPGRAAP